MDYPSQQRFWDNYNTPLRVPPPTITNPRPAHFAYPSGTSLLESLFPHNPILSTLVRYITTPALLSLYCTSHTLRYYIHGQRRLFKNLFLVQDDEAARWMELEKWQGSTKVSVMADPSLYWKTLFREVLDESKSHIDPAERTKLVKGHLWGLLKGHPLSSILKTTELDWVAISMLEKPKEKKLYIASLMSRHLLAMLGTIPIGRRLTTLVLDGSGVETEYMRFLLPQIEGTLRGLSVKRCPNLECFTWSEWLLEVLEETRPIALQWLHIWGSGNTPTTDFDFTKQPPPLEPPEIHPDDPYSIIYENADWNPNPSLFAKLIPIEFHLHNTLHLLPAMTCTHAERHSYMTSLRAIVIGQWKNYCYYLSRGGGNSWVAPAFPLGEPHPLIAFLSITKFLSVTVDIAFCVSRRDCYSFIQGRPYLEHSNMPRLQADVTLVNETTGRTYPLSMMVADDDQVDLHTHCVAEIGARREAGGTICQNCGLWEDELSPEDLQGEGAMKEYAGIRWGTAIGLGRMALGDCCTDCVDEMTCAGCNSFYCPSCTFRSILNPLFPQNTLAVEPQGTVFLKWVCHQHIHGPYCDLCLESGEYTFMCLDCDGPACYGCHGPSGITVSTALYTQDGWDTDDENERFGIVGNISDWEQGAYLGWGGPKPQPLNADKDSQDGSEDVEDDTEIDLPQPSIIVNDNSVPWNAPTTSECYTNSSDYDYEMDPETWRRDPEQLTSDYSILPTIGSSLPSDSGPNEFVPDIDDIESDTTSLATPYSAPHLNFLGDTDSMTDKSWAARVNRMSETRIWEMCARCGSQVCAGCLGYEEDVTHVGKKKVRKDPEYRWCSGGCRKRFCDSCLDSPLNGAGDLICGGIWIDSEPDEDEDATLWGFTKNAGISGMAGGGSNSSKVKKGRCGAVICVECQEYELMLRPTICQAEGELEIVKECGNEGVGDENQEERETVRRQNDRRGVWRCDRCELGMTPRPL